MKKIFTLIAAAVMTFTASAQGTYQYTSETAVAAGTTVDAVPNCTLTFGAAGGADFKAAKADTHVEGYTEFCEGNGENGKFADGAVSGTAYELKPALNGKITVAVVLNANKAFFVYEDGTPLADFNGIKVDEKYYGTYTFDVTGGKTYDVFCTGSKLGFYGFTYEATGGDTPAPAEGETFTLEGAGSGTYGKTFDDLVTPFEFDVKTMEGTFNNFLGGTTTVKLKWEITNPNKDPQETGAMYDSTPVSGLGEVQTVAGYYKMCNINDFTGSVIIKQEGVNFGKLDNILVGVDFSSQIEVVTVDGKRYYELNIMLGGDYSTWNAEKSEWTTSGSNYFKLVKNIPLSGGQTGAIDAIAADVDEDAPVEYYNIQGMRVANPTPGQLVIRRQGNKTSKVIFR